MQPQEENIPSLQHTKMAYTIRTFRGYSSTASYLDAWDQARNQLETIKAAGFGMSEQWVRIEDGFGLVKLVFPLPDGTTMETPWFSNL